MTDRDFDKIFRDKLSGYETGVDEGVWSAIESSLDKQKVAPVAFWAKGRRIGQVAAYAMSAAAVILIAFILFKQESQPYIHQDEADHIAILDPTPSEPEKQQPIEKTRLEFEAAVATSASLNGLEVEPIETVVEKTGETSEYLAENADKEDVAKGNDQQESGEYMADLGLFEDLSDEYSLNLNRRKKYSLSLFSNVVPNNNISVSSQYLSTMAASGISHSSYELQSMEIISEAKYSLPVNLGVQAQVKVNETVSVGVGLSYTWLRSRYDGLINKKHHRIKQSLHYIGIPVNVYFKLMEKDGLRFYANAGGAIEKGVRASYNISSYDGTSRNVKAKIDGFQYSANAGLGLEYRFSPSMGIYLEPNVVYFFDSHIPASIRTDQPLQIKAEIGFRFHFNE